MTIQRILNDAHQSARHNGDSVIKDAFLHNNKIVVKRRQCTCTVLSQALRENHSNMLFKDFNDLIWYPLFEELANVMSVVVESKSLRLNHHALAAITESGRVISWGSSKCWGQYRSADCSQVIYRDLQKNDKLTSGVVELVATDLAFAALTNGGRVVTWGHYLFGGELPADFPQG